MIITNDGLGIDDNQSASFSKNKSTNKIKNINVEIQEKKLTKNKKEIYGQGNEAKIIREELGNFDVYESEAYKRIIKQFGRSIRFSELLGIINTIKIYLENKTNKVLPPIKRNEKRSFPLLIKYIQQNNELIFPYLQYISLCNSSFQKIPLDTKDIM